MDGRDSASRKDKDPIDMQSLNPWKLPEGITSNRWFNKFYVGLRAQSLCAWSISIMQGMQNMTITVGEKLYETCLHILTVGEGNRR